jgi:glycosyltransferase involved in cell wall biosynthesis
MKILVVIPSDPISSYEKKGTASWLKDYYNPQSYFDKVYVLSPKEPVKQEKYGLVIIPVKSNRHYKTLLKKIRPSLVRSYGGYWATDFAVLNKVKGIPILASVHDSSKDLMHDSLKHVDYIVCMSNIIKDILIDIKKISLEKICVLGNRVNMDVFRNVCDTRTKSLRSHFPEGKIILHVGRRSIEKNIENVISSLQFLPKDYMLILVGQGRIDKYENLIGSLEVSNRIFWIDSIKNEELPFWYSFSDVFCVPSRREGFGLVFIEAAACGSKIVTSNIGPMNEFLINDYIMNFLVEDYENPREIADKILMAANCKENNVNTIEFIKAKFEKKIIEEKEIEIYKKVINIKPKDTFSITYFMWKYGFYHTFFSKKISKFLKRIWRKIL